MELELNELLQELYSWRNLLKEKDGEIENLQKQLEFVRGENEVVENSRSSLFHEVAELNSVVTSLRKSLRKIEIFEDERKSLLEERQKLKSSLETQEKLYHTQIENLKQELLKVKEKNKQEIDKFLYHIKNEASKEVQILKLDLVQKENDIEKLKKEINTILNEKEQDTFKIKIQYENKIGKLKQQIPKSRGQTSHGLQMHDIFRQKYFKLEKESQEEIAKLKAEIEAIKLAESLKPKTGCSSLSSVLLATNKQSIKATAEASIQTENVFTELAWPFKRVVQHNNDDSDFVLKKKNINNDDSDSDFKKKNFNKIQAVLPQKKKLFNLQKNYYVK